MLHGLRLAVNADNRLGVRLTQVNPAVGEVDLYTIDIVDYSRIILGKHLLYLYQNSVDIGLWREVDTVLGNLVVGEGAAKLTGGTALLCQARQEEGDTYEGIATIVALRIDDSAITLTADDSAYLFHLRGNVYLAYSSSRVLAAVLQRYIAQGAGRTEVGNGIARGVAQYVVGYAYQRVLLAKHGTVFADKGQAVYIGVYDDTQVETALFHTVHNALKVLLEGLWIMGEVACAVAVQYLVVDTQCLEELGQDDAAYRIDGIGTHAETSLLDSLQIGQLQLEHCIDMATVVCIVDDALSELVDLGILKLLFLGHTEHFGTVGSSEELALAVKQLQGIPLTGIVRGGDDDTTIST